MHKFIDLFSGIGGIRLAFENAGCECVFSSEINKEACETYFSNFGEYPSGDISQIPSVEIPDFNILTGGFPCQPFSIAGFRKGFEDSRGTLFFEIARILKEKQPDSFLLENVAGIVTHDNGKTIETIESILSSLNYRFTWKLINAKDYGVPQNRNRWYCVGFRHDVGVKFDFDSDVENSDLIFQFPQRRRLTTFVSDLLEEKVSDDYRVSDIAKKNIDLYAKENQLLDHSIVYDIRPSRCHFRHDGISPCLTAKMGTGGNNVPVLATSYRKLTERECLRIMGFPESFKIPPNTSHTYKQIGNSVAVPVIEMIANEIVRVLKVGGLK